MPDLPSPSEKRTHLPTTAQPDTPPSLTEETLPIRLPPRLLIERSDIGSCGVKIPPVSRITGEIGEAISSYHSDRWRDHDLADILMADWLKISGIAKHRLYGEVLPPVLDLWVQTQEYLQEHLQGNRTKDSQAKRACALIEEITPWMGTLGAAALREVWENVRADITLPIRTLVRKALVSLADPIPLRAPCRDLRARVEKLGKGVAYNRDLSLKALEAIERSLGRYKA